MKRIVTSLIACTTLLAFGIAFAQEAPPPVPAPAPTAPSSLPPAPASPAPSDATKAESEQKAGKQEMKADKKGGKKRGLDRADEVAGEHGKQGREKARSKQNR